MCARRTRKKRQCKTKLTPILEAEIAQAIKLSMQEKIVRQATTSTTHIQIPIHDLHKVDVETKDLHQASSLTPTKNYDILEKTKVYIYLELNQTNSITNNNATIYCDYFA